MAEEKNIPIEKIRVGKFDQRISISDAELDGLAASIGRVGLLYALIVRPEADGFLLLDGHCRLAACKRLGHKMVRCYVEDSEKDVVAEIAFAGNFFRKDLSPVELAAAIAECHKTGKMSVKDLAAGFHRSEHWVQAMIAICDWPAELQEAVHAKEISVSAASNLACVTDNNYRSFLIRNAIEQGVTARTTSAWLQAFRNMQPQEEAITAEPVPGRPVVVPAVPQSPCFCCAQVYPVNEMSHVPVCGRCVQILRQGGGKSS